VQTETLADQYDLRLLITDQETQLAAGKPWVSDLTSLGRAGFSPRPSIGVDFGVRDDLFSLSFSSGTSGAVKCLKFSRSGTSGLLLAFGRDFTFLPSDSMIAFLPLSTIQQRWMFYTSIYYGFNLCLCTATRLFDALKSMRPTIVCSAPLLFETVESHYLLLSPYLRVPLSLLTAIVGALPSWTRKVILKRLYARIYEVFGGRVRFFLVGSAPSRVSTLRFYESIGLPLYEAWGLTEVGFMTWNIPGRSKIGSVGIPVYDDALSIDDDGEIFIKHDKLPCLGYHGVDSEEAKVTFPRPGLMATGDLGYFKDGFLYISGRKKDLILTRGGVKIQPAELEAQIKANPYVEQAVVFGGDEMLALRAVISLRGRAADQEESIRVAVDQFNRTAGPSRRIEKLVFTDEKFSRDNYLLNRNLKIDRKMVFNKFKNELLAS
jgi:long-subunit acyl-CoA synthetase (AMP-forming)